jgi:hypothetical protein
MNGVGLAENHNERNELTMNGRRLAENHNERNELMMNSTRLSQESVDHCCYLAAQASLSEKR